MKKLPLVVISGKFSGENSWIIEQCVRQAEEVILPLVAMGCSPICAHTIGRFFAGTLTYEMWLEVCFEYIRRCDALFVLPNWVHSSGAKREIELAKELGIPIFYDLKEIEEWTRSWKPS